MRKLTKKPTRIEYDIDGCNVYLSGPVTGATHEEIISTFMFAENVCEWNGATVFNPARHVPKDYSHKMAMLRCISELTITDWEAEKQKPFYDFLIQLDNWRYSEGACIEKVVAEACGIEVITIHEVEWPDE